MTIKSLRVRPAGLLGAASVAMLAWSSAQAEVIFANGFEPFPLQCTSGFTEFASMPERIAVPSSNVLYEFGQSVVADAAAVYVATAPQVRGGTITRIDRATSQRTQLFQFTEPSFKTLELGGGFLYLSLAVNGFSSSVPGQVFQLSPSNPTGGFATLLPVGGRAVAVTASHVVMRRNDTASNYVRAPHTGGAFLNITPTSTLSGRNVVVTGSALLDTFLGNLNPLRRHGYPQSTMDVVLYDGQGAASAPLPCDLSTSFCRTEDIALVGPDVYVTRVDNRFVAPQTAETHLYRVPLAGGAATRVHSFGTDIAVISKLRVTSAGAIALVTMPSAGGTAVIGRYQPASGYAPLASVPGSSSAMVASSLSIQGRCAFVPTGATIHWIDIGD